LNEKPLNLKGSAAFCFIAPQIDYQVIFPYSLSTQQKAPYDCTRASFRSVGMKKRWPG
jgi:hypothetical protein